MPARLLHFFLCVFLFPLGPSSLPAQRNYYQEALEKFNARQYQEALLPAQEAVLQDGSAAHLHLYGVILQALNRLNPAEDALRKAVALAPEQSAFQYDLGNLLHQQRRYAEALPVLKRAVELDPENLIARLLLARTYVFSYHELQIPKFAELTLEQLNFIVSRNPRFPAVHHHLALVHINNGQPAKALGELTTELKYFPENAQARLELGETLIKLTQFRRAAEELLIAARQAPRMASVQFALAKAYKSDGQNAKALEAAQRTVELDPNFADGHYLLGQLYRSADQPDLAKQHFELFKRLKDSTAAAR
jgi:tetratricopeptide (TPR) repeat protein